MVMTGILAGLWLAWCLATVKGRAYQDALLDLAFYLIPAGVAGARIWEVLFTWDTYKANPWESLAFWQGGMSIQGAILGGLGATLLFAWRRRLRIWELLDLLAPPGVLGQGIGRIGCLLSGDAFGRPIQEVAWLPQWLGVTYAPETPAWYVMGATPLVPAEGFEMLLDFLILAFLLRYKALRQVPGRTVLAYAILYSVARFTLEFLRADSLRFAGMKVAQLLSLGVLVVSGVLLLTRRRPDSSPTSL